MAFNSFEVSFGKPLIDAQLPGNEVEEIYQETTAALTRALVWIEAEGAEQELPLGLLEVLRELTPPAHGVVSSAEVRGSLLGSLGRVTLTREHRTCVTRAIGRLRQAQQVLRRERGRVGEFDRDNLSLILRDRAGTAEELRCEFNEDTYDDLLLAFNEGGPIDVLGRLNSSGRVFVIIGIADAPALGDGADQARIGRPPA
jgi:hypothetical protein